MNSFGLGLVLNFVDNATAGMRGATQTFNQMSVTADSTCSTFSSAVTDMVTASYALDTVGSTVQSVGLSILSTFGSISESVIKAGSSMQGYRMQLNALYGSEELGEDMLNQIKAYAASSVFDIESLIPAVTTMKAVGIEAMQEVTTSSGEHTQKLLDYASDIAAMVPNMRNAYGTGVTAAMGALKEYIAEGNAISLKRGAGFDIEEILGEKKGSSIEERTQQIADLVEKLSIVGYTAQLAGTPTQRLSNIQDTMFNTMTKIADSGVFETYVSLLEKASNWLFSIVDDEETFNTLTQVAADTVNAFLSPLQSLLDILIKNGDAIISWVRENPKLTKNILLTVAAVGAFLVVGGTLLKLISSLGMAFAGLSFMKSFPSLIMSVAKSFGFLLLKALPLIGIISAIRVAWKNDLFGIQETVKTTFDNIVFFFKVLAQAWNNNTISQDMFLEARSRGLLPLLDGIFQLRHYWDFFLEGFTKGFEEAIEGIISKFASLGIDLSGVFETVKSFFKGLLEPGQEDRWASLGETFGKFAADLLTFSIALKVLTPVFKIFKGIFKIGSSTFKGIGKIKRFVMGIGPALAGVGTKFGGFITKAKGLWTVVAGWGGKLLAGGGKIWAVVKGVGTAIMGVLTTIASALGISVGWVVAIVAAIIAAVTAIVIAVVKNWDAIKAWCSKSWDWLKENVFQPIGEFFINAFYFLVGLSAMLWEWVCEKWEQFTSWVDEHIIQPLVTFSQNLWEDICGLWEQFTGWVDENIVTPVVDFFVNLWEDICEIAKGIYESLCDWFRPIADWVDLHVISPISNFFTELWWDLQETFDSIRDSLYDAFNTAYDWVTEKWEDIQEFFGNLFGPVGEWFSDVIDYGRGVVDSWGWGNNIPYAASGVDNFIGGLIQVNERGGELITLPSGSTVIPHDDSVRDSLEKGISMGASAMAEFVKVSGANNSSGSKVEHNDYSVTFSAGSIVIQLSNASDEELERAAEKLMKIIERKQALKKLAMRSKKVTV